MKVLVGTFVLLFTMGMYLVWASFKSPELVLDEDAGTVKTKIQKTTRRPASAQTIAPVTPPPMAEQPVFDNSVYDYPQDPEEPIDDTAGRNLASEPESAFSPEDTQAEPIEDPAVIQEAPPEEY